MLYILNILYLKCILFIIVKSEKKMFREIPNQMEIIQNEKMGGFCDFPD